MITNERGISDLNQEEKNQKYDLETKSEESKTPEKSSRSTDMKNNNGIKTKPDLNQETNQIDVN